MIHLALLIVALVLLIIAACGPVTGRVQLGWLGLAFWVASVLFARY